jgi:hypothetical protein
LAGEQHDQTGAEDHHGDHQQARRKADASKSQEERCRQSNVDHQFLQIGSSRRVKKIAPPEQIPQQKQQNYRNDFKESIQVHRC